MEIPEHIWARFEDFVTRYKDLEYSLVSFTSPNFEEKGHLDLYTCIMNADKRDPIIKMQSSGRLTYFDWNSRKHGEVYSSPCVITMA